VIPIYFLGGIQLLCLGVIGEYLAKNYIETKRRPRFLIAESIVGEAVRADASNPAAVSLPADQYALEKFDGSALPRAAAATHALEA
jgi:hypothetical protein